MFGFFNIDKPLGITSHDVVAKVRRAFKPLKVGHAGTLDPLASGVLVMCVGGATRLSDYVMHGTKVYRARVHFGVTTTTYDAEGEIVAQHPVDHITRADLENVLLRFTGEIDQLPPMYSAIKQGGKKLYDLARAGIEVERTPRHITIHAIEILNFKLPEAELLVTCSAGTYIRSLAYDLGAALGVGAHLSGLIRERSGAFWRKNAVSLDELISNADPSAYLVSPRQALTDYPIVNLDSAAENEIKHGRIIPAAPAADSTIAMGYNGANQLTAVLEWRSGFWHPIRVFI